MNFIERAISEPASSIVTDDSDHISAGVSGKADTPVYLLTMYKGIGDSVAFGLSAIDQILQNDPSAAGKIDVLCNHIQAEIFEHDPRVNRIIRASEKLFNKPELTNWLQGVLPGAGT